VGQWLDDLAGGPLGRVTLRELLAHGGGLVRDGWDGDHWQLARAFPDAETLRRIAQEDAGVLARNERFKYSNIGFALLGAIVEAATGESFADHVRTALLEPLALAATSPDIEPSDGRASDHATGYTALSYASERIPFDHIATGAMAAATGFSSTATDVVRWAGAHFLGDQRILSDDAKRQMQRTEWEVEGGGAYGLGFAVAKVGERRVVGHGGGFPGFITRTWFDPTDRLGVSVLTNAVDGPALTLANAIIRLVDLAAGGDRHDADTARDLRPFAGRFATVWGVTDVVALGGRLYAIDPTLDDPVSTLQRLEVVDDDTLRVAEAPGYASPGERFVYDRGPDGTVRSVRGGSGSTALPVDVFTAAFARRGRIRLGDTLGPDIAPPGGDELARA
jgi:CubicO group peptidase (beta-lactamase class C family)